VKLWKIHEKNVRNFEAPSVAGLNPATADNLHVPRLMEKQPVVAASPRRVYANGHAYHINSVSANSDGETYMSADDLRINLWNYEINDQSFSIIFVVLMLVFKCPFQILWTSSLKIWKS
jgi:serine/threonine-protein phosphatase 2A regulatory subunit B